MSAINVGKENSTPIEIYYEDHGMGEAVVLIHGFPVSGASWEKQISCLVASGHRVITYDRRGFGKSSQPATGYDFDTLAADLNKLMKHLDLRDVSLVGSSMGTGEVIRYMGTYGSGRVRNAALIAPLPPFLLKADDNPEGLDVSIFEAMMKRIVDDRPAALSAFLSCSYNQDTLGGTRVSQSAVNASFHIAADASAKGTLESVRSWLTDFRDDLPRIDVPTLIIQGDADRILPPAATGDRLLSLIKGSRLVAVQGGPHFITWTHPEVVNAALLEFLM